MSQPVKLLHIGFGAFARAHVIWHIDQMNRAADTNWGVCVARLHSGLDELEALENAQYQYHVIEVDNDSANVHTVDCVKKILHPKRDGVGALLDAIADPDMEIITLTLTEKGYCAADGRLDLSHPSIRTELANPNAVPNTAIGLLVAGFAKRAAAGGGPLTILSCDNLPGNGALLGQVLNDYAAHYAPEILPWIEKNLATPSSMVDRIVPAMDDGARSRVQQILGRDDPNAILCEPFHQWVIEDCFALKPPPLTRAGVLLVPEVAPFEKMKLRMLNGSHSFLAWFGELLGHKTVAQCMDDRLLRNATDRLMRQEQALTLPLDKLRDAGVETTSYAQSLLQRFANRHLNHHCAQIATDSSLKIPQRLLAPIGEHLHAGRACPVSMLAVAGWMRYCGGVADDGTELILNDPLETNLAVMGKRAAETGQIDEFVALKQVFPTDLASNPQFRKQLQSSYHDLLTNGARATLENLT